MDPRDLRAVTPLLSVSGVLFAYRNGMFPMGLGTGGAGPFGWWSPVKRGVLRPGDLHVSKSLKKSLRKFTASVDLAFNEVITACAHADRDGAWITPEIIDIYQELFNQGHAHSIEVWRGQELAGGLYGVSIGNIFAGESMFHHVTDASKAALVHLVKWLEGQFQDNWLIDTQWATPHLRSLGVSEIDSFEYMSVLKKLA